MTNAETEIRKLKPSELSSLAKILTPDSWKVLMGIIPTDGPDNLSMFTREHIDLIESAGLQQGRPPAEIFLDEWSTMGRKRPTIRRLIDLLVKVELFRAADYLAVKILNQEPPKRPTNGPAAPINIFMSLEEISNENFICEENYSQVQKGNYAAPSINDDNLKHVYEEEEKFRPEDVPKFPFNSKSDLMKFSTSRSLDNECSCCCNTEYSEDEEDIILPKFEVLTVNSNKAGEVMSGQSSRSESSGVSTCNTCFHSNSNQPCVETQNFNVNTADLPVYLRKPIKRDETNHNRIDCSHSEDIYQNLPVPILEMCRR